MTYEYRQGHGARKQGRTIGDNPYDRRYAPDRFADWRRGWKAADTALGPEEVDLFTAAEVKAAKRILAAEPFATDRVRQEIVTPEVMARINRETGQANDRLYMTYRLIYFAGETR